MPFIELFPNMARSPMPIRPGNSALSRVVCTLLELVPCSPQLALHVQMHELRMCPMLVLNSYLRSQDPMSCMQRKCKASKMPGAGLCNSPCACSGGGSTGLRLCNSESLCRPTTRVVASPRETFPTRALFNNRKAPSFLA